MIIAEQLFNDMLSAPVRNIKARVELYNGSTLINTFKATDALKSFEIERVGESKFFGFGICQRLNVKLRDINRAISITTANTLDIAYGVENEYVYPSPLFYVTEVNRDENTNELSITAYDALYLANAHTVAELALPLNYTIGTFAKACGTLLGIPMAAQNVAEMDLAFTTLYEGGANFSGAESLREALNAIAEATQTVYYVDSNWQLVFKRLDLEGAPVAELNRENYFSLESKTNRRLARITHTTELGDNVTVATTATGSTQYVRDNPFWNMREDIDTLIEAALANVGGLTINQFSTSWRGNFLIEIGDKIAIVTKDGETVYSYLLNDTITYNGSFAQATEWNYEDNEAETEANPATIGDALRQTYARVDKQNKQIQLVVADADANKEAISALQVEANGISATVQKIETEANDGFESINSDIATLTSKVDAAITAESVQLAIQQELADGVEKVVTTTGFTFDEAGLTVAKSGSEMTTTITEDGMLVFRDTEEVLRADNEGVKAEDLHATTYLIIGTNSRFENYGTDRTGCFWIGN